MPHVKQVTKKQLHQIERNKRAFKPVRVSKKYPAHPLSVNADFMPHTLDDDILSRCRGKFAHDGDMDIIDLFDPDLDPHRGVYYFQWTEQNVKDFWYGCIVHHLKFLRYADLTIEYSADSRILTPPEILDFFCSERFDEICNVEGWDANLIRSSVPRIVRKYNKPTAGYCKKIIDALTKLADWYYEGEQSTKINSGNSLPAYCY